ncbi:MAG: amidohydrolase family protein [Phycisphaeraceae bacterium]|nr:MAG: amidohydrolase family protein [Phycisphaeraceae bacterium]
MHSTLFCRRAAVVPALLAITAASVIAQPTSNSPLAARPNGPKSAEPTHHVFIHAVVHPEPGVVWEDAVIEIRDGRIVYVGPPTQVGQELLPAGAVVHDLVGEHIYPAFIDPYVEVDAPKPGTDRPGRDWNEYVMPRRSALDGEGIPADKAKSLRVLGYGAAMLVPQGGDFAGSTAVVGLAERPDDPSAEHAGVYRDGGYQALSFETHGWRGYPSSTPGAVSLLRQTLMDAAWQATWAPTLDGSHPANALTPLEDASTPLLINCNHELKEFLAADIAREAGRKAVLVGDGMEFKWLDGIADLGLDMIIPLRFPAKPDVSSVGKAESVELETMMTWEQAPTNPRRLLKAMKGSNLALTSSMLPKGKKFFDELRLAIKNGLGEDDALAMLTTKPAKIAGVGDQVGTIATGKRANLLVTSGPVFDKKTDFYDVWVDGVKHELKARPGPSFDGHWRLYVGPEDQPFFEMTLDITDSPDKPKVVGTESWDPDAKPGEKVEPHSGDARDVAIEGERISFLLDDDDDEHKTYIISGVLVGDDRMMGTAVATDDSTFEWAARKVDKEAEAGEQKTEPAHDGPAEEDGRDAHPTEKAKAEKPEKDEEASEQAPPLPGYPFGPYAVKYESTPETFLVSNATIWTSTDRGRYDRGWLLVRGGRIMRIEPGDPPDFLLDGSNPEVVVIDATGKHLTPGIVDAHSHTGLFRFGVNEGGQAVTAEVRIGDSLDPSDIAIYRELAMGVTCVNSLHGSANPIGGQNQVHKLRWGVQTPAEMRAVGARPGIKFALGENVTEANSNQSRERTRYPQSRMGVEVLIRDRLQAAREYARAWTAFLAAQRSAPESFGIPSDLAMSLKKAAVAPGGDKGRMEEGEAAPRRDLELDALAQILAGDRLIHCHSYRQDEILMLCRVAEDFDFQIGSFQHGLEVYKVAEAVRDHAIGASLFSDWWMYKIEVMDAIPFAGPLQTEAGVSTSYNSDSDELARHLNTEAAKAIKYARPGSVMTEEEALKFVTINAANQIGVGHLVGSLEQGKDADFVIWSANPLSTQAVAEHVFIDGREYFSLEQDRVHREVIARERQRLIQKIVAAPDRGKKGGAGKKDEDQDAGTDKPLVDGPPQAGWESWHWDGEDGCDFMGQYDDGGRH